MQDAQARAADLPGSNGGGAIYEVGRLNGVWQVNRDGVFFGHYRGRGAAILAAKAAARLAGLQPGVARVVVRESDL